MRFDTRLRRLERVAPPAEPLRLPLETRREALAQLAAWQHAQIEAGAEMPDGLPAFTMRRLGLEGGA
jgi:hypothetical protein